MSTECLSALLFLDKKCLVQEFKEAAYSLPWVRYAHNLSLPISVDNSFHSVVSLVPERRGRVLQHHRGAAAPQAGDESGARLPHPLQIQDRVQDAQVRLRRQVSRAAKLFQGSLIPRNLLSGRQKPRPEMQYHCNGQPHELSRPHSLEVADFDSGPFRDASLAVSYCPPSPPILYSPPPPITTSELPLFGALVVHPRGLSRDLETAAAIFAPSSFGSFQI